MRIFRSYTARIIIVNILVYIAFSITASFIGEIKLLDLFALQPYKIIHGENLWTIFTSIFMHANLFHLFVNMFSLFFLGKRLFNYTIIKTGGLEDIIGKKRFLIFYLASGIFASILFSVLSGYFGYGYFGENIFGSSKIIGVGASGAIFGLLGLLAIIMPKKKVFLIAGPLIALIIEAILSSFLSPAINGVLSLIISIYIIFSIFAMFNPKLSAFSIPLALSFWALPIVAIIPLILIDLIPGINLPIGNMAHLGGLIAGLVYGFYLKKRYPNKTNMIAQIFSK